MSSPADKRYAFIATLGLEPQVVTVVIDRLHEDYGLRFDEAVIIHTQPRPAPTAEPDARPDLMQASLDAVRRELALAVQTGIVGFDSYVPLRQVNGAPIYDIYSEHDANAVFRAIDNEVVRQRAAGRVIHLSAAGGRKGMTMYAMVAAQFRFRLAHDRLWLLGSTPDFQAKRLLHTESRDDAFIIPIPIAPPPESFEADLEKRGEVYRGLEARFKQILALIVVDGLGNKEIGERLNLSHQRIEQLTSHLRMLIEDRMSTPIEPRSFREQAIRIFGPYFQWRQLLEPFEDFPDRKPGA